MRLALSRVKAVEALDSAALGVRDGWAQVPSPLALAKGAALLGSAAVVARSLFRASRGRSVAAAATVANPWRGVAAQAVSLLLIPFLHRLLTKGRPELRLPQFPALPSMPTMPTMADIPTPADLFFRWLGLQK